MPFICIALHCIADRTKTLPTDCTVQLFECGHINNMAYFCAFTIANAECRMPASFELKFIKKCFLHLLKNINNIIAYTCSIQLYASHQ